MSWRDTLQPASFRNVPFEVESAGEQGAQRLAVHKYPASGKVEVESLGEDERQIIIEAFVIGANYAAGRDALVAALEQSTPATLIRPFGGQLRVSVVTWQCDENKREGGCATFRITFLRDDPITRPLVGVDTKATAVAAAGTAKKAAAKQFSEGFGAKYSAVKDAATKMLAKALTPIAQTVRTVNTATDDVQMQLLQSLVDPLANTQSVLGNLIGLPSDLGDRIQGMIGDVSNAGDIARLFKGQPSIPAAAGQPTVNRDSTKALITTSLAIRSAELTAQANYVSANEALASLTVVLDQLDAAAEVANPETYSAITSLRTAIAVDIQQRSANLAKIITYTPRETLPALVIAHRLYGSAGLVANTDDLIARNRVTHPGFVPGGQSLEVLTP